MAVAVTLATPDVLVVAVADDSVALAPDPGTVNVTVAPTTGTLEASRTVARSCVPNRVVTTVLCVAPAVAAMLFGALLVRLKLAGVATPATDAVTTYEPTVPLAVAVTLETPEALVVAVIDDSVALAPDPGAVNVTIAPDTGLLDPSRTVTCNCWPNAVLINLVCSVPDVAAIEAAARFVSVNVNVRLPAVAVTV